MKAQNQLTIINLILVLSCLSSLSPWNSPVKESFSRKQNTKKTINNIYLEV